MEEIVFRQAQQADFQAICELFTTREEMFLIFPAGEFPMDIAQLQEIVRKRIALTVACESDRVIGFANFYDHVTNKYAFLGNVVIDKGMRGKNLGRELTSYMFRLACAQYRLEELRLSVFNGNTPALLLYSSLGFIPYATEERRDLDNNRVALLHMRRPCTD